jgi:hypothetical protein
MFELLLCKLDEPYICDLSLGFKLHSYKDAIIYHTLVSSEVYWMGGLFGYCVELLGVTTFLGWVCSINLSDNSSLLRLISIASSCVAANERMLPSRAVGLLVQSFISCGDHQAKRPNLDAREPGSHELNLAVLSSIRDLIDRRMSQF